MVSTVFVDSRGPPVRLHIRWDRRRFLAIGCVLLLLSDLKLRLPERVSGSHNKPICYRQHKYYQRPHYSCQKL